MAVSLVDFELKKLIEDKKISSEYDLLSNVQPASIDLPISSVAYLIKESVIPFNKNVEEILEDNVLDKIDLSNGAILLKGHTYLVKSCYLNFDSNHYATISPKSSIGRIDLMIRSICDKTGLYDTVNSSFNGELWFEISPQSFNVKVYEGLALSQIRIFNCDRVDECSVVNYDLLYDENDNIIKLNHFENKVLLSLNAINNDIIGYESRETNEVLDLKKFDHNWTKFFREIKADNNKLRLEKDKIYILATKEKISVPVNLSAEMVPFSHLLGELRAHYAGFFDPGFGFGVNGELKGARAVLEVRAHKNTTVFHGQPICMMKYFKNSNMPKKAYGSAENNYFKQFKVKLSKYFIQ